MGRRLVFAVLPILMDEWLEIPDRPQTLPQRRLCLLMGLTFLLFWVGAPEVFAAVTNAR